MSSWRGIWIRFGFSSTGRKSARGYVISPSEISYSSKPQNPLGIIFRIRSELDPRAGGLPETHSRGRSRIKHHDRSTCFRIFKCSLIARAGARFRLQDISDRPHQASEDDLASGSRRAAFKEMKALQVRSRSSASGVIRPRRKLRIIIRRQNTRVIVGPRPGPLGQAFSGIQRESDAKADRGSSLLRAITTQREGSLPASASAVSISARPIRVASIAMFPSTFWISR